MPHSPRLSLEPMSMPLMKNFVVHDVWSQIISRKGGVWTLNKRGQMEVQLFFPVNATKEVIIITCEFVSNLLPNLLKFAVFRT